MEFSFIDFGTKDFVRKHNGDTLILEFDTWDDVEEFIMDGNLYEYGWTNQMTQKICWED
jgi:hypothetical protein